MIEFTASDRKGYEWMRQRTRVTDVVSHVSSERKTTQKLLRNGREIDQRLTKRTGG